MLRLIAAHGPTVRHFLDLGCGDGILGAMILERYPTASGVLVDFAEPMLRIAGERLHDYTPNLHFLNLDYGDPRWIEVVRRHAPFDVIVSGYSIHHQPDRHKQRVYREIHDLLAPGGLFINIEYVASASGWGETLFDTHMIQHLHTVKQQRGETITWEQVAAAFHRLMYTPEDRQASIEQQCAWLRRIGFEDVDCYFKLFAFAVFGGRRSVGSPRHIRAARAGTMAPIPNIR
jgi:SAM-dependent methyltransferase